MRESHAPETVFRLNYGENMAGIILAINKDVHEYRQTTRKS
jgi:hypothetical protein